MTDILTLGAMAVGVSLTAFNVSIVTACLVIGGITTVMATLGVLIGITAGLYPGRYAEVVGGLALMTIGTFILYEHLTTATIAV